MSSLVLWRVGKLGHGLVNIVTSQLNAETADSTGEGDRTDGRTELMPTTTLWLDANKVGRETQPATNSHVS